MAPFLSTLSLRRATSTRTATQSPPLNFYPRSPCGERQTGADTAASNASISIHALLAESDAYLHVTPSQIVEFLSTLSLRRATCQRWQLCCADRDFYPRSPCGERLSMDALESYLINISIHALLAESDRRPDRLWRAYHGNFYPRSPCGERRPDNFVRGGHFRFLSTLSLRRATGIVPIRYGFGATFLSTLSLRRATRLCQRQPRAQAISIHALLAESDFFCDF